jgi:hypothetical protein
MHADFLRLFDYLSPILAQSRGARERNIDAP